MPLQLLLLHIIIIIIIHTIVHILYEHKMEMRLSTHTHSFHPALSVYILLH